MKLFNFLPLAILLLKGAAALPVIETVDDITPSTILESRAPTIHHLPTSDATCMGMCSITIFSLVTRKHLC